MKASSKFNDSTDLNGSNKSSGGRIEVPQHSGDENHTHNSGDSNDHDSNECEKNGHVKRGFF